LRRIETLRAREQNQQQSTHYEDQGEAAMAPDSLTAEETRVVEVLLEDWRDVFRCTAIHQAIERGGIPFSHESRLRIAEFLIGDAVASDLMRWAPATYVLTNDEKLIARRLLRLWREGGPILRPGVDEWRRSGMQLHEIEQAFETLVWLGFLRGGRGRYEISENAESFLSGIGFYFHEVVLPARGARFNTNCAPDFFLMTRAPLRERMLERVSERLAAGVGLAPSEGMSQKMLDAIRGVSTSGARKLQESGFYGSERAILKDACGWSDDPIRVTMDRGELVEIIPDTSWYLLGGG
jgi:hypothetical protein